ncbi:MAG TPA: aminotransferase class I/II-fold pyridoxal phosphate-dependent enzyme [Pyrinomonadaceae bacterium]|nr:aminotransferase class I/II-fold pyridoxal phosphate-dependent enzyme [Pyrinomonadaceae bacterium]
MRARDLPRLLWPHRRYHVYSGTVSWAEWRRAICSYRDSDFEDEKQIKLYEEAFARTTNTSHAFSFAAGRMGLYAILEALGIGPDDEVIIPAYTCVVVPNAIRYRGAKVIFVDIDPVTFNIDPSKVEQAITPRTRALYAQHTFGLLCDIDSLNAIARKHGLPVIEDAALALGASHHGRPAGFLSDVGFFSSDYTKIISTQLGGVVTTNDAEIARKIGAIKDQAAFLSTSQIRKMLRTLVTQYVLLRPKSYWLGRNLMWAANRLGLFFSFADELSLEKPTDYPYPARLSSWQARLGLSQLERLGDNLEHRRAIGVDLENRIKWLGGCLEKDAANHAFLRYSFLVKDRERFLDRFKKHFDLAVWFTSIAHGRDTGLEQIGYINGSCPIAEYVARHIVNFPTHNLIDRSFLLRCVDRERAFIAGNIQRLERLGRL